MERKPYNALFLCTGNLGTQHRNAKRMFMKTMPLDNKLIEGWLRLFLGILQMMLATAAITLLLTMGLVPITCALVGGATAATIISRLLYSKRREHRSASKS